MLLATKLMLDWLGETGTAANLRQAVADVIEEGQVRTYDLGGDSGTLDMARAVAEKL
jgi:isocitrate/isopropylmalate dehydrogenase